MVGGDGSDIGFLHEKLTGSAMRWMRRFCFGAMVLLAVANPADAAEPYRVLLLHSFGPQFSPWNTITPAFRDELRKQFPHPIDLYEASLQGERTGNSPSPEEGPFIAYLNALLQARDLKLIVAMGAPSTRFVLRNRAQLFPSTPLLIASSDVRTFSDLALTANETACATTYDPAVQIDAILKILPDTTDLVVATSGSATEQFWTDAFRRSFQRFSPRMRLHWLTDLSAEEMVKSVAELPSRSAIYYPTIRVDARGAPQEADAMLFRFIDLGRAPIFTHVDSYFGQGIVGGPMFSSREIGQRCAEAAVRILNGELPGDVKMPPVGLAKPVYDWRQLQRWKISEASLPAGSEIRFRESTIWDQYRREIIAICVALVLQTGLIVWLLYEHRRRNLAELRSRESIAELTYMNRRAAAGELSASIAHEVSQPLTAISTTAAAALTWLRRKPPDLEEVQASLEDIAEASNRTAGIIKSVRAMYRKDTQPGLVDVNRIITTVLGLARIEIQRHRIDVLTELGPVPVLSGDSMQLQQVVLNLIMNAIEAMQSTTQRVLRIQSEMTNAGAARLSIEDTGTGIGPTDMDRIFNPMFTTKSAGMGMGLSICRTIIEAHKGRIWAETRPGLGSIFRIELPVGRTHENVGQSQFVSA